MASKEDHLHIVEHNHHALVHLAQPHPADYTDWCTVIIYYMALHYIHAYLAKRLDVHPSSHVTLQPLIQRTPSLKPLYMKYRHLEDDSRDARYYGKKFTLAEMGNGSLKWFHDIQGRIFHLLKMKDKKEHDLYPLFPPS